MMDEAEFDIYFDNSSHRRCSFHFQGSLPLNRHRLHTAVTKTRGTMNVGVTRKEIQRFCLSRGPHVTRETIHLVCWIIVSFIMTHNVHKLQYWKLP
jgi:hypothetical protein